jgi:hypothetical protein
VDGKCVPTVNRELFTFGEVVSINHLTAKDARASVDRISKRVGVTYN